MNATKPDADADAKPDANADAGDAATDPEAAYVELDGKDLPCFCPNPRMPLWNHHPRVFLDIVPKGHVMCPYCGTRYRLKPGTVVKAH